jgi:tetratricopeptide (TPR) repeat protein
MAGALIATKGFSASEVQREYERARALASLIDDRSSLIRVMFGIWANHLARGHFSRAIQTAQELLEVAEKHNDLPGRWIGHGCAGINSLYTMALKSAKAHFEQAVALDSLEQARAVCQFVGYDRGVASLSHFAKTLVILGFLDQARSCTEEVRGRALGHTPSRANSYSGAFCNGWLLRDKTMMISAAQKLADIIALVGHFHQFFLLLLAHGQLRSDKLEDALGTLGRAEMLNRSGQKWCEAEVHRLKGDLLVARSANDDAESAYRRALELSGSHEAKLWEIRAATSLGRLWRDQGKRDEARDLLAPVYDKLRRKDIHTGWPKARFVPAGLRSRREARTTTAG